jgi:hypothetical protein
MDYGPSPLHPLGAFRILPMAVVPDGWTAWCKGTQLLALSAPTKKVPAPEGTDTACVSVTDYKRISAQLIAEQESA